VASADTEAEAAPLGTGSMLECRFKWKANDFVLLSL
jgi:hypothetical protein